MTYTIQDLNRVIDGFHPNPAAWDEFLRDLLKDEAVKIPGIGWAYFEERQGVIAVEDSFGYLDDEGPIHFVFRVEPTLDPFNNPRFFKKSGYYDSYDGDAYDGATVEVEKHEIKRITWKEIR